MALITEEFSFLVEISMGGSQLCTITPPLDWIVIERWYGTEVEPYHLIEITRKDNTENAYYADAVIRTYHDDKVLVKSASGSLRIEIRVEFRELAEAVVNNTPDFEVLLGTFLHYTVRMSPLLTLKRNVVQGVEDMNEKNLRILIEHLTRMQNPGNSQDIVVTSGKTGLLSHKCMLAARFPNFQRRLDQELPLALDGKLEVIALDPSAEAGLKDIIDFVYQNTLPSDFIRLGNLAISAKAVDSLLLKAMFLEDFMKRVSTGNVLYAIFFTDLHGEWKQRKQALKYMIDNFDSVQATPEWNNVEVIFTNLLLNSEQVSGMGMADVLRLSLKLHVKMFYLLS